MPRKVAGPHTPESIRALLQTNDRAVERAILRLYERQTYAEQNAKTTSESNGIGFNGADAELLSSFAEQLKAGRHLTPARTKPDGRMGGQMYYARRKILKYARQLAEIANAKAAGAHSYAEAA